jgi:hypothetical protein
MGTHFDNFTEPKQTSSEIIKISSLLDLQQFEDKNVSKNGRYMNQEEMVWCPIKRFNPGAFYKPGPGFPTNLSVLRNECSLF